MTTPPEPRRRHNRLLLLIASFKLFKATMLVLVAIGVFHLVGHDLDEMIHQWVRSLGLDPDSHFVRLALGAVADVDPKRLKQIGAGSLVTAGLFVIEGLGLLAEKKWAEYVTVIITSSLIPFELYEIGRHISPIRVAVLAANVAVVVYLVRLLRRQRTDVDKGTR